MNSVDRQYLQVAFEQAALGRFITTPNPSVGCVIVRDGQVLGRGHTQPAGQAHAEVNALANLRELGNSAEGATAYVSLEPCSFQGRTGPCTQALIDAGIRRVVGALTDPHPDVSGSGYEKLRNAGVEVETAELPEAAELIAGFASRVVRHKPFVRLKAAMSLDGRTAMASGESQWITGPPARSDVQYWRARSCAIVTGRGTVEIDDPSLTVREAAYAVGGNTRQPLRVVLDSRLSTSPEAKVYTGTTTPGVPGAEQALVVHGAQATDAAKAKFALVPSLQCGADQVDLTQLLTELADRHCNDVLVEAGAGILGSFVQQALWDELLLYIAPRLLGSQGRPLFELPLTGMAQAIDATIVETTQIGDDIRLRLRPQHEQAR